MRIDAEGGRLLGFALVLVLCFALGVGQFVDQAEASAFPMTITDRLGRKLEINSVPEKIVTLTPSVTESVYALGAGDQIVGVSSYSDYPEAAAEKPVVGNAFQLNFEQILLLEPDLIIGDAQLVQNHMAKLEELGLPVLAIDPANLQEVMEDLLLIGRAIDQEDVARQVVREMQAKIDLVTKMVKGIPEEDRPLVFVEVWDEPLMTCGPGSFMQELIELAGGENLAADAGDAWVEYSSEQVLMKDPDVILLTRPYAQEVMARVAWQQVRAVVTDNVIEVDADPFVRTTPRLADTLVDLANILHPEIFQ